MKTTLAVFSLALVFLPLGGCGSPDAEVGNGAAAGGNADANTKEPVKPAPEPEPEPAPTVGTYELDVEALTKRFTDAIEGELNSLAKAMLANLRESSGTIVLKEDASFIMNLGGQGVQDMVGTWVLEEDKLSLTVGTTVQVATLADGVITMVVDDTPTGTRTFIRQKDVPKDDVQGGDKKK